MTSLTPTAASAMIDFADLAVLASAEPDVIAYLKARGIDRTATLALIASTDDVFIRAVADPFVNCHVVGGTTHKARDGEGDIARAILLNMWMEAYIVHANTHASDNHDYLSDHGGREAAQALLRVGSVRGGL